MVKNKKILLIIFTHPLMMLASAPSHGTSLKASALGLNESTANIEKFLKLKSVQNAQVEAELAKKNADLKAIEAQIAKARSDIDTVQAKINERLKKISLNDKLNNLYKEFMWRIDQLKLLNEAVGDDTETINALVQQIQRTYIAKGAKEGLANIHRTLRTLERSSLIVEQ